MNEAAEVKPGAPLFIAMTLLSACQKQEPAKPKDLMGRLQAGNLSDEDLGKVTSMFPGMTRSCIERVRKRGINAMGNRVDACFEMTPRQRWKGIWRNGFEDQAFCAAPAQDCPAFKQPKEPGVAWIEFASSVPGVQDTAPGGLYAIEFVGRATAQPGDYGGYGFYGQEVIVHQLLSIREVKAPPPQPTKAEMIAYFKKCEAKKTCIPNWNEINAYDEAQEKKAHTKGYLKDCAGKPICMPNSEIPEAK